MSPPNEPTGFERDAARQIRAFRDARGAEPEEKRRALAEFVTRFYSDRLRVEPSAAARSSMDDVADPDAVAVEIAHDGQLPHLGIVRMVLKADEIARLAGNAVTLYLVGNHYSPDMRSDNIHFGLPLKGNPPDAVKHPPKIRIGKANAHRPFRWLPPPAEEELGRLRRQVDDFVANNLAHERTRGKRLVSEAEETVRRRTDRIFDVLEGASRSTASMGDWLIRVQHDIFHLLMGPEADRVLFLPMADLTELFRDELAFLARNGAQVAKLKAFVSEVQEREGRDPYQRVGESSVFWVHCPSCMRRQRTPWSPGKPIGFTCRTCGHRTELREPETWRWLMPDIVAYQVGAFGLGLDGWVVGSHAAYHPVIRKVSEVVFRRPPPPTFILDSVPTFRGAGDAEAGFRKTRLLRALLEIEPGELADALRAPWAENPLVTSDLFVG